VVLVPLPEWCLGSVVHSKKSVVEVINNTHDLNYIGSNSNHFCVADRYQVLILRILLERVTDRLRKIKDCLLYYRMVFNLTVNTRDSVTE
jgi:hypothetical protein